MSNLGQFIKNERDAVGLSQDELGAICGISDATIQRIETGKTKQPGWELLCKIAKAVKIHPFEILKESGYITDEDISPSHRLNGLEDLDRNEFQSVQVYIDFMMYRKNNCKNSKEELESCHID